MSDLAISVRTLRRLVEPVIPSASNDRMLPVLNAVRIESRGRYLVAFATDRLQLATARVLAPEQTEWPEFAATVPLTTLRSILATDFVGILMPRRLSDGVAPDGALGNGWAELLVEIETPKPKRARKAKAS